MFAMMTTFGLVQKLLHLLLAASAALGFAFCAFNVQAAAAAAATATSTATAATSTRATGEAAASVANAPAQANVSVASGDFDGLYFNSEAMMTTGVRGSRYNKVLRHHSGKQLVEVMHDRHRKSLSLYLDRALQLTDLGEHMYHEMMAHTALFSTVERVRDVLVIGAGDGGVTLRVLMHPEVERVVQVELDEAVVNASREYFPQLAVAYDDPRVDLKIEDAIGWSISEAANGREDDFDAIIIDSTDEPLISIWTTEFYTALRKMLRPGGVLMQNVQSLDVPAQMDNLLRLHKSGGFTRVRPVLISTIDYGSPYVAYLSSDQTTPCPGPNSFAVEDAADLKAAWYSLPIHRASLMIPPAMVRRWPDFADDVMGCTGSTPEKLFGASSSSSPSSTEVGSAAESSSAPSAPSSPNGDPPTSPSSPPSSAKKKGVAEQSGDDGEVDFDYDVVVVGGGLAGVTAAHLLTRSLGTQRVLLLEAADRLGGRIETTEPANFGGVAVNVGANWIHFAEGNPILRLAERLGCPTKPSANGNLEWHAANIGRLSEESIEEARSFAAELGHKLWTEPEIPQGVSAAALLREWSGARLKAPNASAHAARQVHFFTDSVQDNTAYLGDVSASRLCDGVCGGDPQSADRHFVGEEGTMCLINSLLAESPSGSLEVRKHQLVKVLKKLPKGVEVEVLDAKTWAVSTFRARTAVLAVPLGVLQASLNDASGGENGKEEEQEETCDPAAGDSGCAKDSKDSSTKTILTAGLLTFEPKLPESTASKWLRLGTGQSLRGALLFERIFWNETAEFLAYLMEPQMDSAGEPPADMTFFGEAPVAEFVNVAGNVGKPVLLFELGRHLATKLESLSDAEIGAFLHENALKPMYPHEEVPKPIAVHIKRYAANPLLRGALSYSTVREEWQELREGKRRRLKDNGYEESRSEKALDLWAPLWEGRLQLAGEHTTLRIGTLDGAFISGLQAAWNAACTLAGPEGAPLLNPIEFVRAIGIFGDWFPQTAATRKCLQRFVSRGHAAPGAGWLPTRGRRSTEKNSKGLGAGGGGHCGASPRWLEELEVACRVSPSELPPTSDPSTWRHCLDQGD